MDGSKVVSIIQMHGDLIAPRGQIWNRITGNTGADAQVAQAAKFNEIDAWSWNGWNGWWE